MYSEELHVSGVRLWTSLAVIGVLIAAVVALEFLARVVTVVSGVDSDEGRDVATFREAAGHPDDEFV